MGYTRIGQYFGDPRENYQGKRSYFQSSVAGKNAFRQGAAQTVHDTYMGINAQTGTILNGTTAGAFFGKRAQRLGARAQALAGSNDNKKPDLYLIPRFNEKDEVIGYERPMDPTKLSGLKRDTHLGRMLGVWAGRILEEEAASAFNTEMIKTMHDIWKSQTDPEKHDRSSEFDNVADPKHEDPIIRDAWKTLGWRFKADVKKMFGREDFFPIRRDMVDDAIGFRKAGLTDFWTGSTRFSPGLQEGVKNFAQAFLGNRAYELVARSEKLIENVVSYDKTTMVVRSIVVTIGNSLSNMLQLSTLGIDPVTATVNMRKKLVELAGYTKNREEIQRLKTYMSASIREPAKAKRAAARIQALEDANARLSIVPLLKAGEFSTISENLTEADTALREGKMAEFFEKAVDALPGWTKTTAKNLLITKDTALFKGLNRAVQYGDFLAKAVLYDHLTQNKGMSEREALDLILEEFVQYNRSSGLTRSAMCRQSRS
jgi:hypothetical protein